VRQHLVQPEKSDLLHSKQYAVFAQNGAELRNTSSNWNTTVALDSRVCANGIAYVLYEKQFAEEDTETSAYPAKQYVIERSGEGRRSIVPIPHVDGDWRDPDRSLEAPLFGDCFDRNVGLLVNGNIVMITPHDSHVDYRASDRTMTTYQYETGESSEGPYQYRHDYTIRKADYGYWIPGRIYRTADSVEGSADISFLSAGGSSFKRKPVFFRDIRQYPVNTTMTFLLDPQDYLKVIVELSVPSTVKDQSDTVTYFKETNHVYQETTKEGLSWETPFPWDNRFTPLYVSAEQNAIVVKSYFFEQSLMLHAFPGRSPVLQWYRVGPLERDGTRKVWYAFTVNGHTQTWFAVVK
jgi:hypothetical protein